MTCASHRQVSTTPRLYQSCPPHRFASPHRRSAATHTAANDATGTRKFRRGILAISASVTSTTCSLTRPTDTPMPPAAGALPRTPAPLRRAGVNREGLVVSSRRSTAEHTARGNLPRPRRYSVGSAEPGQAPTAPRTPRSPHGVRREETTSPTALTLDRQAPPAGTGPQPRPYGTPSDRHQFGSTPPARPTRRTARRPTRTATSERVHLLDPARANGSTAGRPDSPARTVPTGRPTTNNADQA